MDMARRRVDLRLEEELLARLDARAEELGQTRTKFVERALESALSGVLPSPGPARAEDATPRAEDGPPTSARVSAPTRAPAARSAAMERQARLNAQRAKK